MLRVALRDDRGSMTVLLTGLMVVILLVIALGVAVTGLHLARTELQSVADGAALRAAAAADDARVYDGVAGEDLLLDAAAADAAAQAYIAAYPANGRLRGVRVTTRVTNGAVVEVTVTARTDPPLVGWLTSRYGGGVGVTATSSSRSH